jgi:hypothetical protein
MEISAELCQVARLVAQEAFMRSGHARLGLLVAALSSLLACSSGGTDGSCTDLGQSCAAASDCCSGACSAGICVPEGFCGDVGGACDVLDDCCTGLLCSSNGLCVTEGCLATPGAACSADTECCSGACNAGQCGEPEQPTCGLQDEACTANDQCCSKTCASGKCTDSGVCTVEGSSCAADLECCSKNCLGETATSRGTCDSRTCIQAGDPATQAALCCSKTLANGLCQQLGSDGTKYACTTSGEACGSAVECCSRNCQGGTCVPASYCSAPGDICLRPEDCCSGLCTADGGSPGRCDAPDGGCTQDGVPCTNDSNCCTRKCVDLGSGTKVCQPAGGCRMTGSYCDSTDACCGGTNEQSPGTQESTYGVFCDGPSASGTAPEFDSSSKNDRTCSNGQSCNPPGNICGAFGDNASQNCCVPGNFNGSGKIVCKLDTNDIPRCFGSPPGGGTGTPCPTGYDWSNPECCRPIGEVCQIREQCCDLAPCVPDAEGVLRCTQAAAVCNPRGAECGAGIETPCCAGTTCQSAGDLGYFCTDDQGNNGQCVITGGGCTANTDCCSRSCSGGVCSPPAPPCQGETASCTVNADCCSGLSCDIAPGATSGFCKSPTSGPTCSESGQACTMGSDCCNAPNEECVEGVCALPPPLCGGLTHSCSVDGDCCEGLYCNETSECAELVCAATGSSCTLENPLCCESGASCRNAANPSQACTDAASCACVNMSVCAEPSAPCAPTPGCCDSRQYCAETSGQPCGDASTSCTCRNMSAG